MMKPSRQDADYVNHEMDALVSKDSRDASRGSGDRSQPPPSQREREDDRERDDDPQEATDGRS
jgi:hypothetical protein